MSFTVSGTSGLTFPDATNQTTAATASVPAGAITNFANASAPTGWTQVTTYNNYAMRIVSGTGAGTGGSVGFTTAFASQAVSATIGGYTLTTTDIPSHNHSVTLATPSGGTPISATPAYSTNTNGTTSVNTGSSGGGGSHTHSFTGTAINLAVQYVDNILCQKS
jgi:hypothetical protein